MGCYEPLQENIKRKLQSAVSINAIQVIRTSRKYQVYQEKTAKCSERRCNSGYKNIKHHKKKTVAISIARLLVYRQMIWAVMNHYKKISSISRENCKVQTTVSINTKLQKVGKEGGGLNQTV
jgi:hypothetical protein